MNHHNKNSSHFNSQQVAGYVFLIFLVFSSVILALDLYDINSYYLKNMETLGAIGVGFSGSVFVFLNRVRLKKIDQQTWSLKQKKLQASEKKFLKSYPNLSKVPIVGFLLKKWQAEPFIYKVALLGLTLLASGILFYDLVYYDWLPDEFLGVRAAKGYIETGTFNSWDFEANQPGERIYHRAWMYSWMLAQSFQLFGISEWSARIVSVLLGVISVPIIYSLSNFILRNRAAALTVTFIFILNPYLISYFRRTRMYALLVPCFAVVVYMAYQSLVKRKTYNWTWYRKSPFVRKYLNYDWGLVIMTLIGIYFIAEVHKFGVLIVPPFFFLFLYLLIIKKQYRLLPILFLGLLMAGILIVQHNIFRLTDKVLTFLGVYKPQYFDYLLLSPFQPTTSIAILCVGLACIFWMKNATRLILVYLITIITLVLFVYCINYSQNTNFRYILHIMPFSMMAIVGVLYKVNKLIKLKQLRWIIPFVIVLLSVGHFKDYYSWVYRTYPDVQFFRMSYPTIQNNIDPDTEGIVAMFLQSWYLRDMEKKPPIVKVPKGKKYKIKQFVSDLNSFEKGAWVTWPTHKAWHLRPEIIKYAEKNCTKYHGRGKDNTLVEVYYCRKK